MATVSTLGTIEASAFGNTLKDSIIEEKRRILELLQRHLVNLQETNASDAIIKVREAQLNVVVESIEQLNGTESGEILRSTLEELDNTIMSEYLDLMTNFVGEDSNWPIAGCGEGDEKFIDEMLRF